jgi:hypothetical protein
MPDETTPEGAARSARAADRLFVLGFRTKPGLGEWYRAGLPVRQDRGSPFTEPVTKALGDVEHGTWVHRRFDLACERSRRGQKAFLDESWLRLLQPLHDPATHTAHIRLPRSLLLAVETQLRLTHEGAWNEKEGVSSWGAGPNVSRLIRQLLKEWLLGERQTDGGPDFEPPIEVRPRGASPRPRKNYGGYNANWPSAGVGRHRSKKGKAPG